MEEDQVKEHLNKLEIHKPIGAYRLHPGLLKDLVDDIVLWLSIICESSWRLGDVTQEWKRANVTFIFKKVNKHLGNYKPIRLISTVLQVIGQIILEDISKHVKDRKVTRSSQHGFMKMKPCLIALYDEILASWMSREQQMLFTLSFQSFQGCIPNIPKDKSHKYVTDKRTVMWPGNRQN